MSKVRPKSSSAPKSPKARTVKELRTQAKAVGIKGASRMNKATLTQALAVPKSAQRRPTVGTTPGVKIDARMRMVLTRMKIEQGLRAMRAAPAVPMSPTAAISPKAKLAIGAASAAALTKPTTPLLAKLAGRALLPAFAAYSAYHGATEDKGSPLRGVGRGLARTFDPTAIVMSRGLAERGYDSVFGRSTPAYLNASAAASAAMPSVPPRAPSAAVAVSAASSPGPSRIITYQTKDGRSVQLAEGRARAAHARRKD